MKNKTQMTTVLETMIKLKKFTMSDLVKETGVFRGNIGNMISRLAKKHKIERTGFRGREILFTYFGEINKMTTIATNEELRTRMLHLLQGMQKIDFPTLTKILDISEADALELTASLIRTKDAKLSTGVLVLSSQNI